MNTGAAGPLSAANRWPLATPLDDCEVCGWAASGAMALTGPPDRAPDPSPAPAFTRLNAVLRALAEATADLGRPVVLSPGAVLTDRAAGQGFRRQGSVSAGGSTRLLRTADGWCALTLSRPDDFGSVPAIVGGGDGSDPWDALAAFALHITSESLAERAQLFGVPAAALAPVERSAATAPPWRLNRLAEPVFHRGLRGRLVVDLSSMWAGPLCAHVLGRAGAEVIKVESPHRPDGARADAAFFDRLHAGHEFRSVDFRTDSGRAELARLLDRADIVIEASRPRALAQLGLGPDRRPLPTGQIWVSLTGYGRDEPMRVAFGDDAAVAGGLVGWDGAQPVFCADAVGDPLSGICAALAVCECLELGGGVLADISMRAVTAAFAAAAPICPGPHTVRGDRAGWSVHCTRTRRTQPVAVPGADQRSARSGGVRC
ncbi:MAG: CoA transferase [Nocardia sp.]|nr:CoA transferase [Nocardia sp.]